MEIGTLEPLLAGLQLSASEAEVRCWAYDDAHAWIEKRAGVVAQLLEIEFSALDPSSLARLLPALQNFQRTGILVHRHLISLRRNEWEKQRSGCRITGYGEL